MPEKQISKTTQSKSKKSAAKDSSKRSSQSVLKDILKEKKSPPKQLPSQMKPKFRKGTKTVKATTFELNMTLEVTTKVQEIIQPKKRIETLEKIIDKQKQIFKAGTASIILRTDRHGLPAERVMGIEAKDVEIILQLFGLAK